MPLPQRDYYTYSDYAAWPEQPRYELIDGIPFLMSPAPAPNHQRVSGELSRQLANFLKGKTCEVFAAPFAVRLNQADADDTVVQPDLVVICDKAKIDDSGCVGAPDMVIEILSPSTSRHDRMIKANLYRKYGVREYWIVDAADRTVEVLLLENGKYVRTVYGETDIVSVQILPGLEIALAEVFASLT